MSGVSPYHTFKSPPAPKVGLWYPSTIAPASIKELPLAKLEAVLIKSIILSKDNFQINV